MTRSATTEEERAGFASPLGIAHRTELTGVDFGAIEQGAALLGLRWTMAAELDAVAAALPEPLAAEARATIGAYAGGGDFFRLFHPPVWSFLHWAPASTPLGPELVRCAVRGGSLALFLHLWDDHLCDGQLPVDMLRLQLRSIAWERFTGACRRMAEIVGRGGVSVDESIGAYLRATHRAPEVVGDLDAYCRRSLDEMAIWRIVPHLLDAALDGARAAEHAADDAPGALARIVGAFSIAWRLVDDVQDLDEDLMAGKPAALGQVMSGEEWELWHRCRARSAGRPTPEPESWRALLDALRSSGAIARLLDRASSELALARELASLSGLEGLAAELAAARAGVNDTGERALGPLPRG